MEIKESPYLEKKNCFALSFREFARGRKVHFTCVLLAIWCWVAVFLIAQPHGYALPSIRSSHLCPEFAVLAHESFVLSRWTRSCYHFFCTTQKFFSFKNFHVNWKTSLPFAFHLRREWIRWCCAVFLLQLWFLLLLELVDFTLELLRKLLALCYFTVIFNESYRKPNHFSTTHSFNFVFSWTFDQNKL